ncbi:PAS domain S-box-containing protein/diguanylate cyclase (GGDEF)-like protein [Natranaerovirga hydrolytica]|uniref:PAS domain S-box-containing protein/diguanylate cyclase (GGDEF)-like protein n=1 Tax=Natranaerovirga hydrolytica TaxID=680378 RepID=A0A4R1ME77_9FIRM|nr:GGDEF domain-containing phosphodiesterase [Natranaerovirga hydrolytica]TCK90505.1 PAS domain S-box-containing protein/diguanylate cyclase (GGDEF)-like protein [Natranaerovirga hydrolytica]
MKKEINIEKSQQKINPKKEAMKITILYVGIGLTWIFLSDRALEYLTEDSATVVLFSTYKGWLFVLVTGLVMYCLIKKWSTSVKEALKESNENLEELTATYEEVVAIEEELMKQNKELQISNYNLLESEQRYALAVEGVNDGVWEWDIKKDTHFYSTQYKKMLGYETNEIEDTKEQWMALVHQEDQERVFNNLDQYLKSQEGIYEDVYRMKCKNGEYKTILSRAVAVWNGEGEAIRMVGSHSDVTENKILEKNLNRAKAFSKRILDEVTVIVIIWDRDTLKLKEFNKYAEIATGYAKEEVIGKNWIDIFIPQDAKEQLIDLIKNATNIKEVQEHENQWVTKDGVKIDVLWNNKLLYDTEGNIDEIVSVGTNITERKQMESKLYRLAYYDILTELPNRAKFEVSISEKIQAMEPGQKCAILFMDIDNFKHINDTLGHTVGDELLVYISRYLDRCIKEPNIVSRIGGDEFVVYLQDVHTYEDVVDWINQLLMKLRKPWVLKKQEFFISLSIGVALFPDNGEDPIELMKNADTAMYCAKEKGKDQFAFYTKEMEEKTLYYIHMVNRIRKAIEKNEFSLVYQPFIDLETKEILGVEALIRWNHPTDGYISPVDFIPIAESNGMITQITKWVIKNAIEQKVEWKNKDVHLKMSVNLSGNDLVREEILEYIKSIIEDKKLKCKDFQIEITETAMMSNLDKAVDTLTKLRELGVQIALDDFGTGYSSLNYIKNLPIDVLKMDRDFINTIINENEEEALVSYVIKLAQALNLKVIAEGIETKEQEAFLLKNKCNMGQGYLYSKPIDPKNMEKIYKKYLSNID